jgi:hypothetical protein
MPQEELMGAAGRITWAGLPRPIKVHATVLAFLLIMNIHDFLLYAETASAEERHRLEWAFIAIVIAIVALFCLYILMLNGIEWARIALGLVTFPIGLLLLVAPSVRQYTMRMGALSEGHGALTGRDSDSSP